MNIFKELFGRLCVVWAALLFTATMMIFFVPFFLFCYFRPEPQKTNRFILYSRVWMNIFLILIGCPLKVKGRENFAAGETYIVLCNHNTIIDVPASSTGIPGGNKTIAKIEMAKIPLFGFLYKTGSVLVDRKSEASRRESLGKMKEVLSLGLHMCIYPEGTRNKTNQPLKSFHDGGFKLAIDTKKSIIPGVIFNTKKVLPPDKFFFLWPHSIAVHFLEPFIIQPTDTVESLKNKIFETMKDYYTTNQK
jgi:1-acyl-sn-glycerol-3-phosphate acyltransferase